VMYDRDLFITCSLHHLCDHIYDHQTKASLDFFFFQAEDGIRDFHVTGVQTCALPISVRPLPSGLLRPSPSGRSPNASRHPVVARSEERRVGKSVDLGGGRVIKQKTCTYL